MLQQAHPPKKMPKKKRSSTAASAPVKKRRRSKKSIIDRVLAELEGAGPLSLVALKKRLGIDKKKKAHLQKALKKGLAADELEKRGQTYALPGGFSAADDESDGGSKVEDEDDLYQRDLALVRKSAESLVIEFEGKHKGKDVFSISEKEMRKIVTQSAFAHTEEVRNRALARRECVCVCGGVGGKGEGVSVCVCACVCVRARGVKWVSVTVRVRARGVRA